MPPVYAWSVGRLPIPGQQLIKPVDGVIVDTGEQVSEPSLRINRQGGFRRKDTKHLGVELEW